jgi:outer membrane protein TolC
MCDKLKHLDGTEERLKALHEENKALQEKVRENRQRVENGEVTDPKQLEEQTKERKEEQNRIEANADSLGEDEPDTKQSTSYSKTIERGPPP